MDSSRICLGVITGVKGVRGEVRIRSFTANAADVAAYGPVSTADGRKLQVRVVGQHQGLVIARLDGIADRDAAEALKGTELFIDRAKLPAAEEGSFYYADLVGLKAALTTGEIIGTVTAVDNFGAGEVLEITGPDRRTLLVPFTEAAIAKVDIGGGVLTINPLPGLFDDGEDDRKEIERGGDAA